MAAIIQFRRDTAANWTSNNPTMAVGEIGYESDNEKYKIGDGSTAWTSLGYGGLGDISKHLIDAKGDLIVGTADNTPGILTVGTNGQMLVADSAAAGGVSWAAQESIVNWHEAVKLASVAALPNTPSYSNGSSGVGATLTTSTQVRLVVDGVNATTGDRVLVQDQSTAAQNGIYDVTAQGASGSAVWLLTRVDDFDGTPTGQIKSGESVYVLAGSTNAGQGFVVTSTSDPHTVGTHSITFTQFTGTQAFTAGTELTITGNTINHDASGVSAASYGSATQVPGYTVDATGHLTTASNTTIAIPSTAVTDFTEAVQDVSGAQVATNGSHTGISASYDDGGDGAIDLTLTASGVSAASYGSATQAPGYTVDTYGRLTAASNTTIAIPSTAVTDFAEAVQDVSGAQLATNGTHTGITAAYDDAGDGAIDLALVTENVQDISGAQLATNGSHTGITATYDDAGDGAIDLALITENVQDITGAQIVTNGTHVGLTAAYDDAGDGAVDLTVAATLGTHTSGNYVATVAGTANEVDVSGSGSETAAVTVGLPNAVTITTSLTTPLVNVSGASIVVEGATANDFETTLTVTDPTADRTVTFQDASGTVAYLASPTFTGVPAAPTAAADTNTTQVATTAYVQTELAALSSDSITDADGDTKIQVEEGSDEDIIRFDTAGTERMSIGATGVVTIVGDLTVNGTTTTVNSTTLTVDDKNIEIGSVASPSDTTADGGGITLKGASDKTWNWVNATDAWTSSEHVALATGKSVYIDGVIQLSKNALAATVVLADGVIATTQSANDSSTKVATTAFVMTEVGDYAPLASPTLTGVPAAPTAAADTNTTQVATTAYVQTELGALSSDSVSDADGDTKIQVEESSDEDKIRFDVAGTERAVLDANALDVTGNVIYNLARETQTGTTYTFVAGDRGKYVTMNNGSAQTVTVPPNSGVAFAVGTQIQVIGLGAGEITMAAGSGVTLRYTPGLKLRAQYSSVTCIKIDTDEWVLVGDLEA
jgi:predicted heme/steroid binding protein